MHKKNVIRDGTHTSVREDSVGPTEVIYGFEHKHFFDVLFIHLNLFGNNSRHLKETHSAVFTLLMYGIYADP